MARHRRHSEEGAATPREVTDAREALERRWFRQRRPAPEFRTLVTGADLRDEPFHRWLPYRQAFAPALVRRFLAEAGVLRDAPVPVLDPFAGAGTTAIECARSGVPAVGVEALRSLAFLARARGAAFSPVPRFDADASLDSLAALLEQPLHRAALLIAHLRRHSNEGRPLADAPPLGVILRAVLRMIRDDLAEPLPVPVDARAGDARALSYLDDASVGGLLTSPPYLSRHDYERITKPAEALYARWYGPAPEQRETQVRAHPRARGRAWSAAPAPGVEEACAALRDIGAGKLAGVVRSYFDDLSAWLEEVARVLVAGAPGWIVIGGARLRDVYVPSDLILAEIAASRGLLVEELWEARRLIDAGRKLGGLDDVAPRESIIVIRG